jgi:hypothetical protein
MSRAIHLSPTKCSHGVHRYNVNFYLSQQKRYCYFGKKLKLTYPTTHLALELAYVLMSKRVCVCARVCLKGVSVVSGEPHASAALLPGKDPLVPIE